MFTKKEKQKYSEFYDMFTGYQFVFKILIFSKYISSTPLSLHRAHTHISKEKDIDKN